MAILSNSNIDYSSVIRKEIEDAVKELIFAVENFAWGDEWEPANPIVADYIELGYIVNLHKGKDLYKNDDLICGLPVTISSENIRSITVGVEEEVIMEREVWCDEEDSEGEGEGWYPEYDEVFVSETIIW